MWRSKRKKAVLHSQQIRAENYFLRSELKVTRFNNNYVLVLPKKADHILWNVKIPVFVTENNGKERLLLLSQLYYLLIKFVWNSPFSHILMPNFDSNFSRFLEWYFINAQTKNSIRLKFIFKPIIIRSSILQCLKELISPMLL